MDAKEYLCRLQELEVLIEALLEEARDKRASVMNRSKQITGVWVKVSHDSDKLGNALSEVVDLGTEMEKLTAEYLEMRETYIHQIRGLRNIQYTQILYRVYINHQNLKQCAADIQMSYTSVLQKHKEALNLFGQKYAEEIMKADEDEEQKFRKPKGVKTDSRP